jgi:hypothetical protein
MRIDGARAMITLEREQSLRLERGVRIEVVCGAGVLWITQEGDVRDLFLAPGERLLLAPRGVMLITALERSRVDVRDVRVVAALARAWRALIGRARVALRWMPPPASAVAGLTLRR